MEDVLNGWTREDHADAARLLRHLARKGAGALSPDQIEAGLLSGVLKAEAQQAPERGRTPRHQERVATPRVFEMGSRSPRPDGGLSSCLRPVAQARASNDNEPGHAAPALNSRYAFFPNTRTPGCE